MAFGPIMKFTVSGLRIELAPLTKEAALEIVNHEHGGGMQRHSIFRYLGRSTALVAEDETDWYERTRTKDSRIVWGIWLVEEKDGETTRTLIGNSALTGLGEEGHANFIRQATSGSVIFRPEYWGRGIASAAHKARTWYAFQYLGLHRIKSAVLQSNGGSRKALERSGYTFVYTERNEKYDDGQLLHLDCLECINPLDLFWTQWWHGDRPTTAAREARKRTLGVMAWAAENVELV